MILRRDGFTLIELLVVMSIIGILAAALTVSMPKVAERARDMKCKTNLRNIGQAALAYAVNVEHFPHAYSGETRNYEPGRGVRYGEVKAWVNWTGNGVWPNYSPQKSMMATPILTGDLGYEAITNGVLWDYIGKDASSYLCPAFKKQAVAQGLTDIWRSYVMNRFFHWHNGDGNAFFWHSDFTRERNFTTNNGKPPIQRSAETILMFAELPAEQIDTSTDGGDGVLDPYGKNEHIGFNHRVGKRNISHLVYADGHVGVLLEPSGGSPQELVNLTKQLCHGEPLDRSMMQQMR
jgi:prepilin-type N-terminal cleavage/methylation domain-containing protein